MTRESKVAIILGFAVVLVVAALISDHFSHARRAQIDNSMTIANASHVGATSGIKEPIGDTSPQLKIKESAAPESARTSGPKSEPPTKPAGQKPDTAKPTGASPADDEGPSPYPGGNSGPVERAIAREDLPITSQKSKTYQVKDNDSLYRIAKNTYGDGSLWKELAEFNKDKVGANNALRAGSTITLPPKDVLTGDARLRTENDPPASSNTPASERRVALGTERPLGADREERSAKYVTYTIRKGDHLSTIAQRLLGSTRRMDEILKLNPSLDDEDSIREGMVIKIPKS